MSRRFFIRACGNCRQRRGDIHVARERALLRCVCVRHVRSVASVSLACAPSCLVGVCLSAPVPGVINGAPTGYATVRSWCPVVFSSVRVGTAVSVGATFMSPAWVRRCAACAPSCLVGVCLSASVPGVINGAPTGWLFCVRGKAGRFSIAGVRTPATGGVLTCVAARKTGRFPAWFVAVGTAPCGCGQGWCQSMRFT